MKISDRITGPLIALFGAMVIVGASQLPTVPGVKFGADLMPNLIGIGLIMLGLTLLLGSFRDQHATKLADLSEWDVPTRNKLSALWCLLGLVVGGLFFEEIGFPIIGVAYMAVLMTLMRTKPHVTAVISILVTTILYVGFATGLLVPLPTGILGGIFS